MYDPDDITRSVRRYVAELLGPPWELDLERRDPTDDTRPAGLVELGQARVRSARVSIPQGWVTMFMPVTVTLYPSLAAPREAGRTARHLAYGLQQLVQTGLAGITFADGRRASGPERIPLYDYSEVELTGTDEERTGPVTPHDVLWAEDYGTRAIQDPMDPQRWTVVLELRVSWEQPGRADELTAGAPLVGSLPGTFTGPPPSP